jgi:hypothetical protein
MCDDQVELARQVVDHRQFLHWSSKMSKLSVLGGQLCSSFSM